MQEAEIRTQLRRYLNDWGAVPQSDEDSLLDVGVLDSGGVVELVAFIESQFEVELEPTMITEDNFSTIQSVAQMVCSIQK
uniref:Putative D-alanine--poly(Phosphoribitol) ligase subunit 2 n=1 Tax=Magnetococcus massalia (strain MO-1) TaxID=451514 RepID=A0A1S7LLM5_MAGMO|nr:putative D-alanine--poly(phosphoribitol) ligase subunit 2 [Candidatus Magnetococcus massalia]